MTDRSPLGDGTIATGQAAMLACLVEASVPKVGNIHRSADFEDATFYDFLVSAVAIGHVFEAADQLTIGELVWQAVSATRQLVGTNTNLGMLLLMAPIAKCMGGNPADEIGKVLREVTRNDRDLVYEAIRLAKPGGLGSVEQGDVFANQADDGIGLIELMKLAQDRDTIAKQYATDFREVIEFVLPTICSAVHNAPTLPDGLVHAHLKIMATIPDTLIARKCGIEIAQQSSTIASQIVNELERGCREYHQAIEDFDFWLRSDGHRRNPGTSADLVAAGLFLGIQTKRLSASDLQKSLTRTRNVP